MPEQLRYVWDKLITLSALALGASFVVGNFFALPTPLGDVRLLDLAAGWWILMSFPRFWQKFLTRKWLIHGLFLIWLAISTYFFASHPEIGLAYVGRWAATTLAAALIFFWLNTHRLNWAWLRLLGFLWLGVGIGQYLLFPDTRLLFFIGWDDHLFRAFGSVFDPLFFGLASSTLAWLGYLGLNRGKSSPTDWMFFLFAGVSVVLSFSRFAWMSMFGWMCLELFESLRNSLSWKQLKNSVLAAAVVSFVLLLILVPKDGGGEGQKILRTSTLVAREASTTEDISVSRSLSGWVWGSGWYVRPNAINQNSNARQADSALLQLVLSAGILPSVVWFACCIRPLQPRKIWIWFGLGSLVSPMLFSPWVLYPLVLCWWASVQKKQD